MVSGTLCWHLSGMFENGISRSLAIREQADQSALNCQRHALPMFVDEVTKQRAAVVHTGAGFALTIIIDPRAFW